MANRPHIVPPVPIVDSFVATGALIHQSRIATRVNIQQLESVKERNIVAHQPYIVLPRPQRRFIRGHWSANFQNTASQPLYNAASGLTYPHAFEG